MHELLHPQNLVEFAKQHGVSLTTHNDESEILPQPQLQSTLSSSLGGLVDPTHWRYSWVTRYSSVVRLRGIVAHKGYVSSTCSLSPIPRPHQWSGIGPVLSCFSECCLNVQWAIHTVCSVTETAIVEGIPAASCTPVGNLFHP